MIILKKKIKIKKFKEFLSDENHISSIRINNQVYKIYTIKNVKIVQAGHQSLAVLKKNFLIDELSFQSEGLIRKNIYYNKILKKNYFILFKKKIRGTTLSLLQDVSQKRNYFHFIFDSISRLFFIDKIKKINFDNVLIPSLKYKFQNDIMKALNLNKKLINSEGVRVFDLEKLIVIDHPYWKMNRSWNNCSKNIPLWSIKFLKKKFINYASKKKFSKKIFIDRSDTNSIYGKLKNLDSIKKYLIKKKFQILQLSKISFFDQIRIFNGAKIIITPHGAALSNLIFCKPKTKILRFKQKEHNVYCFDNIIRANKLSIKNLICKTLDKRLVVDLNRISKFLKNNKKS